MNGHMTANSSLIGEKGDLKEIEWFEDILACVGYRGKFQVRLTAFVFLTCCLVWMATQNQLYALYVPEHWCHVPGRETTNYTIEEWKNVTLPTENGGYSKCKMFSAKHNNTVVDCDRGWDYDDKWFSVTIPSEQNWVCEKKLYMNNAFSISQGIAAVLVLFVCYSGDRFGRRLQFGLSVSLVVVGRMLGAFSPSVYVLYLFLMTIGSSGNGSACDSAMSLAVELVDEGKRSFVNVIGICAAVAGRIICALIAWISGYYLHILLATLTPLFLLLFLLRWLPESPRWLISKGRYKEAYGVLERIARINGEKLPPGTLGALEKMSNRRSINFGIIDLVKNKTLRFNTLILVLSRFVTFLTSASMAYNVNNIPVNPFAMHIVFAIVELPAMAAAHFLGERIGRRCAHSIFLFLQVIASAVVILLLTVSSSMVAVACVTTVLSMVGQSVRTICNLQSLEIHPTCVRQTASAVEMFAITTALVVAPYLVYLHTVADGRMLYGILGALQLITSIAVCFLPETLKRKLPETLEDAENLGVTRHFWSLPATKQPMYSIVVKNINQTE